MPRRSTATATTSYEAPAVNMYAGATADERRAQRRERLIRAAFALFAERGYTNTTIQHIVDEADCGIRTFYEEFGTREALLEHLYEIVMNEVMEKTLRAIAASEPGRSAMIRAGVKANIAAFTANRVQTKVALIEVVAVSSAIDKRRRETLKVFVERLIAVTESKAGKAQDIKAFDLMFLALTGAAERLVTEWVLSKGRVARDDIAETLCRLWLSALPKA